MFLNFNIQLSIVIIFENHSLTEKNQRLDSESRLNALAQQLIMPCGRYVSTLNNTDYLSPTPPPPPSYSSSQRVNVLETSLILEPGAGGTGNEPHLPEFLCRTNPLSPLGGSHPILTRDGASNVFCRLLD